MRENELQSQGDELYTTTVNQKSSLQKAILSWKIKQSRNTLNKGTDNHLSEPTNREGGFAMATSGQTVMSMLRTIHRQRKSKAGTLLGISVTIHVTSLH